MSERKCLITGGSGFIGSHLINYLLSQNRYCRLYILDTIPPPIIDERIVFTKCDIRNPIHFDLDGTNIVCYHLAALSKEPGYEWEEYFYTNFVGTLNLIEFAEQVHINNIVFTSTMMVYRAGDEPMSELSMTAPDTAYGISKLLAEYSLRSWANKSPKRRLRLVRAAVVFGKGENGNFTRLYNALKGRRFFYVGRPETVKSCIYVKDVVRFLEFLTDDSAETLVYNMAYPYPTTVETLCKTFFEVFCFKRLVPTAPYRLALIVSYFFEWLTSMKVFKSDVHHRRIQKLYFSTNISADEMKRSGFELCYSLPEALEDWKKDCAPDDIY
jgi:nucleoside-diphosphate-sugar epimerase